MADGGADEANPPADLVPGHELLEERARGGQATVWKALHLATRRTVAVKLYPRASVTSARARLRFEREAELLGRLRHPGIVTVHDAGVADGRPYLATEWVEGLPIDEHARARHLPLRDRLHLFIAACRAVHAAHQRQVLHLDIKPSNILVDAQGPRVLDFGVSRFLGATGAADGGFAGTLSRAAPEHLDGVEDLDVRTDVYALGVLLHELVTGERWPAARLGDDIASLVRERLGRSCATADGADADIDAIVRRAAAPDRDRRYPSAEDLARDVENWLAGRPLAALSHDRWHVLRKTAWTHRRLVATVATIALVSIAGVASIVASARQADEERDAALAAEARAESAAITARQTTDLLLATFEASSPLDTDGATVSAREVLEAGRRRLASDPLLDAAVRTSLWQTMGRAYEGIGLFAEAEEVFRVAADTSAAALARGDDGAAAVAADLARIQRLRGALDESLATCSAAAQRLRAAGRTSGAGLGYVVLEQAVTQIDRGEPGRALALARTGLHLLTDALGPDDPDVADAHATLGLALVAADRPRDAAQEFALAQQRLSVSGLKWAARALFAQSNLAAALSNAGDLAAATTAFEDALERQRAILGPDHPKTLGVAANFAGHLYRAAQHERAVEILMPVLEAQKRILGPRHPRLATTYNNLAANLLELRKLDEAEAYFREQLAILESTLGVDNPKTARALSNLASVYQRRGEHEKSRDQLMRAADIQRTLSPEPTAELLATLDVLGVAHLYLGDLESSEIVLRECVEGRRALLGKQHPAYANTLVNLAAILRRRGKLDEALALQVEAVKICREALPPEHPLLSQALHNLANIQLARHDIAAARAAAEEAVTLREAHHGAEAPGTLESLVLLSRVLEEARDPVALATTARLALGIAEKMDPPPMAKLGELRSLLGSVVIASDRAAGLDLLSAGKEALVATNGPADPATKSAAARLALARGR